MLTQTFTLFGGKEPQVFFYITRERHLANNNNKLQSSLFKRHQLR